MRLFNSFKTLIVIFFGVFCLLIILFFLNFSFSKKQEIQLEITPVVIEDLKAKLAALPKAASTAIGLAEASCYQITPGCEFWAEREDGFPSDYEFSEQEEYCMFNWCLSWEPAPVVLEFTGEEITLLLNQALNLDSSIPFKDPRIIFEGNLIKGSVIIAELPKGVLPFGEVLPMSGILYVEGYLERRNEWNINFELKRAQFNNLELKGAIYSFVGDKINAFFNDGFSQLEGFRIDKLEVSNNKLHFEGIYTGLPSNGSGDYMIQTF